MLNIELHAMNMAIETLTNLGCKFKVITPDGESFGELETVAPKPPRKRVWKEGRVYGELKQYTMPLLDLDMPAGKLAKIPSGKYTAEEVRSSVCATLTQCWGSKTYKTEIADDMVYVIRLPEGATK